MYSHQVFTDGDMRLYKAYLDQMEENIATSIHRKTEIVGDYRLTAYQQYYQGTSLPIVDDFVVLPMGSHIVGGDHIDSAGEVTLPVAGWYLISGIVQCDSPGRIVVARIAHPHGQTYGTDNIQAVNQVRSEGYLDSTVESAVLWYGYCAAGEKVSLQAMVYPMVDDANWIRSGLRGTAFTVFLLGDGAKASFTSPYTKKAWAKGESTNLSKFQTMENSIDARMHPETTPYFFGTGSGDAKNLTYGKFPYHCSVFSVVDYGAEHLSAEKTTVTINATGYYLVDFQQTFQAENANAKARSKLILSFTPGVTDQEKVDVIAYGKTVDRAISASAWRAHNINNNWDLTCSGAAILHLNAGDQLSVQGKISDGAGQTEREWPTLGFLRIMKLT